MLRYPIVFLVLSTPDAGLLARADGPPPTSYETVALLPGDLAGAIPVAAKVLLGNQQKARRCLDQLRSYNVHVSREADRITVVLLTNKHCGEGILGGGGRVVLDASTYKVLDSKGGE